MSEFYLKVLHYNYYFTVILTNIIEHNTDMCCLGSHKKCQHILNVSTSFTNNPHRNKNKSVDGGLLKDIMCK